MQLYKETQTQSLILQHVAILINYDLCHCQRSLLFHYLLAIIYRNKSAYMLKWATDGFIHIRGSSAVKKIG